MLIGIWPLVVIVAGWSRISHTNADAMKLAGGLLLGGIPSTGPLLIYHVWHGSVGIWIEEVFLLPVRLVGLDFLSQGNYLYVIYLAFRGIADGDGAAIINGIFWLILLALPFVLGVQTTQSLLINRNARAKPLAIVAVFAGLSALHIQIPIYLVFVIGLTWAAMISLLQRRWQLVAATSLGVALTVVALVWQAAQPLSRGFQGIVNGQTGSLDSAGLPKASIWMEERDAATYREILAVIEQYAAPEDPILAMPMAVELYFLSGRHPPSRYITTFPQLQTAEDLTSAMAIIDQTPPAVIINVPGDKYQMALSLKMMEELKQRYSYLKSVGRFDLYVRKPG